MADHDPTTAELVQRARRGEAEALEALVRQHLRPAFAVALAMLKRTEEAEDVAQEAVIVACERLETCRDPARFAAWLFQIVRNRARNALAARRVREPGEETDAALLTSPVAAGEDVLARQRLLEALDLLTEVQRETVLLHDLHGWTHGEIALALEMSEVSSRQHLFVARRRMREQLGESGVDDE